MTALQTQTTAASSAFRLLDALLPADRAEWLELWEEWPDRDVMAHPDYVRLFSRPGDRAVAASMRTERGGVLYPLIIRPLASEPWSEGTETRCDLTTPYGYGGPFAWGVTVEDATRFWKGFEAWALDHGAVASFVRFSLFPGQLLPFPGEVIETGLNVIRRVDLPEEDLLRDFESKVRANVRRARRNGVTVEFDEDGRRLDAFIAVYTATMDRRKAAPMYYFSRSFFEGLVRDLAGSFLLVHAIVGRKVVSSEFALLSADHAYFFLAGTYAEALHLAANDLLKYETILRCRAMGKKALVLGGGVGAGSSAADGLLRYKLSFAPHGAVPFKVGRMTHDEAACARLVDRRRAWERGRGQEWEPARGFFPPYRSETGGRSSGPQGGDEAREGQAA